MGINLSLELAKLDCDHDAEEFRDLLVELKAAICPNWSVDELLANPQDALAFCTAVRCRTGCADLPDDLILRTLTNQRRTGRIRKPE